MSNLLTPAEMFHSDYLMHPRRRLRSGDLSFFMNGNKGLKKLKVSTMVGLD